MRIHAFRRLCTTVGIVIACLMFVACGAQDESFGVPNCQSLVSGSEEQRARSQLSFTIPSDYAETPSGSFFGEHDLLTIFVFESESTSPRRCVEKIIEVISAQTNIQRYSFENWGANVAGEPASVALAEGHSPTGKQLPYQGVFVGFSHGDWIYVFAWDRFGNEGAEPLANTAQRILASAKFSP
jgi:hypothetical protein